jgi:hypothetical protein
MNLKQLKLLLEGQDPNKVCKHGFGRPHAHRGYYDHVSFPPTATGITIAEMLEFVDDALEDDFTGWKGGEYSYNLNTPVHFNYEGYCDNDDEQIPELIFSSILE